MLDGTIERNIYSCDNLIFPFIHISRYLQNVRIEVDPGRPSLEFDADGTRSSVELTIVNLQPSNSGGSGRELLWRQVSMFSFPSISYFKN